MPISSEQKLREIALEKFFVQSISREMCSFPGLDDDDYKYIALCIPVKTAGNCTGYSSW